MKQIEDSELIINSDGSIYHLHLKPEHISDKIIFVGDPDRVKIISSFFDKIEYKIQNREFITHTGYYKNKRITIVATGIGTDNIDIVVNELDAIVNIDIEKRTIKENHTTLNFVRLGTSGALQDDIPVDSYIAAKKAIGFDGLLNYYANRNSVCDLDFETELKKQIDWNITLPSPYVIESSEELMNKIAFDLRKGYTISASGFYGPQGRVLRLPIADSLINDKISNFNFLNQKITNYEMECSAIYGLSKLLGHNALTICAIIANRMTKQFSKDINSTIKDLIKITLERI